MRTECLSAGGASTLVTLARHGTSSAASLPSESAEAPCIQLRISTFRSQARRASVEPQAILSSRARSPHRTDRRRLQTSTEEGPRLGHTQMACVRCAPGSSGIFAPFGGGAQVGSSPSQPPERHISDRTYRWSAQGTAGGRCGAAAQLVRAAGPPPPLLVRGGIPAILTPPKLARARRVGLAIQLLTLVVRDDAADEQLYQRAGCRFSSPCSRRSRRPCRSLRGALSPEPPSR